MRWLRSLLGVLRPGRRIVGTDLHGNTYFEVDSSRGGKPAVRREVLTKLKHSQYEDGSIPIEWESWIRGKRNDPPTHEELIKKMQQRVIIKQRANILEKEHIEKMNEREKENSQTTTSSIGHASAHVYEKQELKSQPTRTGDSFQPGAWIPSQGGRSQEDSSQQESNNGDNKKDFEPEGWVPPKTTK